MQINQNVEKYCKKCRAHAIYDYHHKKKVFQAVDCCFKNSYFYGKPDSVFLCTDVTDVCEFIRNWKKEYEKSLDK
jgi:hypothetical protein